MANNMKQLNTKILLRTDTTAEWLKATTAAPGEVKLLKGEIGIELLTDGKKKIKIGDGITSWENLDYFGSSAAITSASAPTPQDVADVGTIWVTDGGLIYVCVANAETTATWQQLGTAEDANTTYTLTSVTGGTNEGKLQFDAKNPDKTSNIVFKGAGSVKVTSSKDGVVITGTDNNDNTTYDLNTIQNPSKGVLKFTGSDGTDKTIDVIAGDNVTISSTADGKINIASSYVDTPDTNTFYDIETTESNEKGIITLTPKDALDTSSSVNIVGGKNISVKSAKENKTVTIDNTFAIKVTENKTSNGLVTKVKKGTSDDIIEFETGVTYITAIDGEPNDTTLPTAKAVNDLVTSKMSTVDAMRYKTTLGEGQDLPTENVKKGDTYKVTYAKEYADQAAQVGDIFIANKDKASGAGKADWDLIPSGDDGNTFHDTLTTDALVVGRDAKTIKSFANGQNDQVLKIVDGKLAWAEDNDTQYKEAISGGASGLMSGADKKKLDDLKNYILPEANSDTLGGIKADQATKGTDKVYDVKLDSTTKRPFVQVDWTDNNTTYSAKPNNDLKLVDTEFEVQYSKNNLTTDLNKDADTLVLFGGYATGWEKAETK